MDDAIRRRALAFARTLNWVNARIISSGPADPKVVATCGDPENASYGEVRLVMEWSDAAKSRLASMCDAKEAADFKRFIDADVELLVVCSAHDVIHHEFPNMDLC